MTVARRPSLSSVSGDRRHRARDDRRARRRARPARRRATRGVAGGHGRTFVVGGEAGIGKTRLVVAMADRARLGGTSILSGDCLPTGMGTIPYAPFVEALRRLTRASEPGTLAGLLGPAREELGRLIPELAPRPPVREVAQEPDRSGQGTAVRGAPARARAAGRSRSDGRDRRGHPVGRRRHTRPHHVPVPEPARGGGPARPDGPDRGRPSRRPGGSLDGRARARSVGRADRPSAARSATSIASLLGHRHRHAGIERPARCHRGSFGRQPVLRRATRDVVLGGA